MPSREPLMVEFHEQRRSVIVERMAAMAAAGSGWINFSPGLDVDVPPPSRSAFASLVGGRGPDVPLATWAPARGRDPATVGIQHGQGPRAVDLLAERHVPLPDGWRKLQDHPKRGLVVALAPTEVVDGADVDRLDEVLDWLLRATGALCPVPRTGEWRAYCYGA